MQNCSKIPMLMLNELALVLSIAQNYSGSGGVPPPRTIVQDKALGQNNNNSFSIHYNSLSAISDLSI